MVAGACRPLVQDLWMRSLMTSEEESEKCYGLKRLGAAIEACTPCTALGQERDHCRRPRTQHLARSRDM